jgi:hypothetical protein
MEKSEFLIVEQYEKRIPSSEPLFGKTDTFWGNPIVTIFYGAETRTKFSLVYIKNIN